MVTITAIILITSAAARYHRRGDATAQRPQRRPFDYYVLSLSWSPEHCATKRTRPDDTQCGTERRYGFVVHGLWPQYETGFPESCDGRGILDRRTVDRVSDIMPSAALVRHEWGKHGACSGLDPQAYFAVVRTAFEAVAIPPAFARPTRALRLDVRDIKRQFEANNPALHESSLAVVCDHRYLREVRVCLDEVLRPRRCGRDVRDRCYDDVIVRPVR